VRVHRRAYGLAVVAAWALLTPAAAVDLTILEDGTAAKHVALGNEVLVQGRYESAIKHYRQAVLVDKQSFTALFNLGLAYQQLGQLAEARRWYDESLKARPGHPEALCNLGVIAFRAGEFREAVGRFEEAAGVSQNHPEDAADYWFNAGTAREALKEWSLAQRAYQECLVLNGLHAGGHYNLATLYLGPLTDEASSAERALAHLRRAVELQPDHVPALINLALAQQRTHQGDPGATLDQAVTLGKGTDRLRALWARATAYDQAKPPRRLAMRDDLRAILAEDPDYPQANGLFGRYHYDLAEFPAAVALLEREVASGHDDATSTIDQESHFLLAVIYTDHRPDPAKALAHASAYYRLHPDSRKIHELRRRALNLQPKADSHPATTEEATAHAAPTAGHGAPAAARPSSPHAKADAPAAVNQQIDHHAAPAPAAHDAHAGH